MKQKPIVIDLFADAGGELLVGKFWPHNKAPCKEEANLAWGRSVMFGPMLFHFKVLIS